MAESKIVDTEFMRTLPLRSKPVLLQLDTEYRRELRIELFANDFRPLSRRALATATSRVSVVNPLLLIRVHLRNPRWLLLFRSRRSPDHARSRRSPHPFAFSNCSACCRDVSVNFSPLNMRAISSVCSGAVSARTRVFVRPAASRFSIR